MPLRCNEDLFSVPNDPFSVLNYDMPIRPALTPSPGDVHQYCGPSNFWTTEPSSSRQPLAMVASPPRLTEDIMDDTDTNEEHDGAPM